MSAIPPHNFETFFDRSEVAGPPQLHATRGHNHWEIETFRQRCLKSLETVALEREALVAEVDRDTALPGAGGEAARHSHFGLLNELARRMSF